MSLLENIKMILQPTGGEIKEKKDTLRYTRVVAERKAFLVKQKLEYRLTMKVDDAAKKVVYSEGLFEKGAGMTGGDDMGGPGFGFSAQTYKTGVAGPRQGTITQQSDFFGKKYSYNFDFNAIRPQIEAAVQAQGYTFEFSL